MTPEAAKALLEAVGSHATAQAGKWVRGPCPLARWRHQKGTDSKPSFGIHADVGEPPRFHCFTCLSGSMATLFQTLEMHLDKTPGHPFSGNLSKAREIVELAESELPVLPGYSEFNNEAVKLFEELPMWALDQFTPALGWPRSSKYCHQRGFSAVEVLRYDIRYDQENDLLVFPYWDVFGRLAGIRGRSVVLHGEQYPKKHHDYVFNGVNNAGLVFYNEPCLNLDGPVIVVEGQVDCIKVARLWPKVVANLTAKPVQAKLHKLAECEGVILLLDGDATGRIGTARFTEELVALNIPVCPIKLPWDPEAGVKTDPDSLGDTALLKILLDAGLQIS